MYGFGFLWSLLNLSGVLVKQHVMIQTPPMSTPYATVLEQTLSHGIDPFFHERKVVLFSNELPYFKTHDDTTCVPMSAVFHARDRFFPRYHMFSRSHYLQFSQGMYSSIMNYAEYCAMEDKLAHIVCNYLEDRHNHWLIMMDDPFLMGSLRNYGSQDAIVKRTTWITTKDNGSNDLLLVNLKEHYLSV